MTKYLSEGDVPRIKAKVLGIVEDKLGDIDTLLQQLDTGEGVVLEGMIALDSGEGVEIIEENE